MLLIAIVSLQFILLHYSCAPFVLTKKLYIYIYISAVVNGRRVLQKTQLMNYGHAKIMSYEPHMQTQSNKTFNYITSMYTAGRTQRLNGLPSMEKTDTKIRRW